LFLTRAERHQDAFPYLRKAMAANPNNPDLVQAVANTAIKAGF
jgi:hypothetical protein